MFFFVGPRVLRICFSKWLITMVVASRPVARVFEDEKPGASGGFGCLAGLFRKSFFETANC